MGFLLLIEDPFVLRRAYRGGTRRKYTGVLKVRTPILPHLVVSKPPTLTTFGSSSGGSAPAWEQNRVRTGM